MMTDYLLEKLAYDRVREAREFAGAVRLAAKAEAARSKAQPAPARSLAGVIRMFAFVRAGLLWRTEPKAEPVTSPAEDAAALQRVLQYRPRI